MKNSVVAVLILASVAFAAPKAPAWGGSALPVAQETATKTPASAGEDISGMYTFLHDGEFVEVDVEEGGRVTGFVSRYGEADSDRGAFLDHMFSKGVLDGKKLAFTTREVHGVSFDFKGKVERGPGKEPGSEAYYILRGTLTQTTLDENKKPKAQSREVEFKSFPADAQVEPRKKD